MPTVNGRKKVTKTPKKPRPPHPDHADGDGGGTAAITMPPFASVLSAAPVDPPLRGRLPLRRAEPGTDGGAVPAVLFAPAHLRAKSGSGGSPGEAAATASASAAVKTAKQKKPKKPKHPNHPDHPHHPDDEEEPDETPGGNGDGVATPFHMLDAEDFLAYSEEMLDPDGLDGDGAGAGTIAGVAASYDFDEYVLLRNPDDPYAKFPGDVTQIPADPRFARFCNETGRCLIEYGVSLAKQLPTAQWNPFIVLVGMAVGAALHQMWYQVAAIRAFNRFGTYRRQSVRTHLGHVPLEQYYAWSLCAYVDEHYRADVDAALRNPQSGTLGALGTTKAWDDAVDGVFDEHFRQLQTVDPTASVDDYAFEPYSPNEILFGLRIVHRQDWRRLGYARGELVKSIPLGPRETQRLSVEISTRRRTSRSSEQTTSFETTSESTNTSRNTTEVVDEASEKLNRNASASVGGGYPGVVSAEVSAGIAHDMGSSSRQTKASLNELMEKTASRMKRDIKVTVSTENETTFKDTRTSEITNPNDELGITYLYYRLQLRYWVTTEMAAVESVVFVPQRVPDWDEIDEAWVRDHADALAGVLLDPSLAPVLTAIRQEPISLAYQPAPIFDQAASASISALTAYKQFTGGGDMPDILASGQEYYARDYERRANLRMEQDRRQHQTASLLIHLRRNILHYMRAVWESEDYDQRMQRYSRMRVPVRWNFVPLVPLPTGTTATPLDVEGVFMPDPASGRPLSEVIDPVGPIGYHLNCAIYRLRDDGRLANLHQALSYLRAAYARFAITTQVTAGNVSVRQAVAQSPRSFSAEYTIQFGQQAAKWLMPVTGQPEAQWPVATTYPDGSVDVEGIRVWLTGTPAAGDTVTIRIRVTPDLEDPYLKLLRVQHPLPEPQEEAAFFADDVLRDMPYAFPELESVSGKSWADLTPQEQAKVRALYHVYVMYRDSGRLVTIDTPNLVLDLEGSTSPALEPFKRLHRYVDVLKEFEEMRRRAYDNRRRHDLIDDGVLGDPDIDRVTLVGGSSMLRNVISVEDPDE